ncbi:MAG: hypothetical protein WBZ36_14190 [Candidatus Nitrosopolaris sp.]
MKNENLGNATDILDSNNSFGMALPNTCSFRDNYIDCPLPPSHIISVVNNDEEYCCGVSRSQRPNGKVVKSYAICRKNPTR